MSDASPLRDQLRSVPTFADLDDEVLDWIAAQCRVVDLADGDVIVHPGDPAEWMFIVLRGEIHSHPVKGAPDEGRVYVFPAGELTGMLPFSRLKTIPRLVRAVGAARVACFPATGFPEMLQRAPVLESRLVTRLTDRVRQTTRTEQQRDRLASLGRLSAGLAHEMNNPAAAARRSASELRSAVGDVVRWSAHLGARADEETVEALGRHRDALRGDALAGLSTLDRADREDGIATWLEARGVEDGADIAPTLMEAGVDPAWLDGLEDAAPGDLLPVAVRWVEAVTRADDLLRTVQQATARISALVAAVKEYTFMDRAALQDVDVNAGLDSTLRILARKLEGVNLERRYAPHLPTVRAYGAELNQVWTNLIDNAAYAAGTGGHVVLTTSAHDGCVTVEVRDDGPGIAAEDLPKVFDPFYSTKPVGEGSGLGLDIVRRIVEQHHGQIFVDSKPGDTRFGVELPVEAMDETPAG